MKSPELDIYTADREMAESLRLEMSSIDPHTDRVLREVMVPEIVMNIVSNYHSYIPEESLQQAYTLPQRVVFTDPERLHILRSEWLGEENEEWHPDQSDGLFLRNGGFVIVTDHVSLAEKAKDELREGADDIKKRWIELYGTEEEGFKVYGQDRCATILIHEICHSLPKDPIYNVFEEHGVCYYTDEIGTELGTLMISSTERLSAQMYRSFLKKKGESVHRAFFGSDPNKERVKSLQEEFISHVYERLQASQTIGIKAFYDDETES